METHLILSRSVGPEKPPVHHLHLQLRKFLSGQNHLGAEKKENMQTVTTELRQNVLFLLLCYSANPLVLLSFGEGGMEHLNVRATLSPT